MSIPQQRPRNKATPNQLAFLIDAMSKDADMANGVAVGLQGRLLLESKWQDLTTTLNALGGPSKTPVKWKQTWRDLRNKTRNKLANNKAEYKGDRPGGTGNGPPQLQDITSQDEAVLAVIGEVAVHGIDIPITVPEPAVCVDHSYSVPPTGPAPPSPIPLTPAPTSPAPLGTRQSGSGTGNSRSRRGGQRRRVENFDHALIKIEEKKLILKERKIVALERWALN